jgi:hypothetical protein
MNRLQAEMTRRSRAGFSRIPIGGDGSKSSEPRLGTDAKSVWCGISLTGLNWGAGLFHFLQSGAIFIAFGVAPALQVRFFLILNVLSSAPFQPLQVDMTTLPYYPVIVAACFALLSAGEHLLLAAWPEWYDRMIKRQYNYVRWMFYFISSSIMLLIIMSQSGILDLYAVIGLMVCNSTMILMGDLSDRFRVSAVVKAEQVIAGIDAIMPSADVLRDVIYRVDKNINSDEADQLINELKHMEGEDRSRGNKGDLKGNVEKLGSTQLYAAKVAFLYGCFVGVVPWICLITSYSLSVQKAAAQGLVVPWFVHTILFVIFAQFMVFGVNHGMLVWDKIDFPKSEVRFILLSMVCKTSLTWLFVSAVLVTV